MIGNTMKDIFQMVLFFGICGLIMYQVYRFCRWVREGEDRRQNEERRYRDNVETIVKHLQNGRK